VFSCLLNGTFKEWTDLFTNLGLAAPTYNYPTKQELINNLLLLKPKKYFFYTKEYLLEFANVSKFVQYLNKLGANVPSKELPLSTLKRILPFYSNKLNITYNVFFCILENGNSQL
jgi:malonyl-CoA O-methyltransferase